MLLADLKNGDIISKSEYDCLEKGMGGRYTICTYPPKKGLIRCVIQKKYELSHQVFWDSNNEPYNSLIEVFNQPEITFFISESTFNRRRILLLL